MLTQFIEYFTVFSFISTATYLVAVDLRTRRLPNSVVVPMIALLLVANFVIELVGDELGRLFVSIGIPLVVSAMFFFTHLIYPAGLGMGDIKVILLIGLVLAQENPAWFFTSVGLSFLGGAIFALGSRVWGRVEREFAFGPFLLLPAIVLSLLSLFR